jgi:hypothetical protein
VAGNWVIIRWRFWWRRAKTNSIRRVNLIRVGDGLIVEAMGYVKGQSSTIQAPRLTAASHVG